MDYSRLNKLSFVFDKKASTESFMDCFNHYEKVTDAIDDINHALAGWYYESVSTISGNQEARDKFSEVADKAQEIFAGALESIKPQLEPLENEMDKIFEEYLSSVSFTSVKI